MVVTFHLNNDNSSFKLVFSPSALNSPSQSLSVLVHLYVSPTKQELPTELTHQLTVETMYANPDFLLPSSTYDILHN